MKNLIECYILWFDDLRGEGRVRCLKSGNTAMIYACNIKGKKTWYPETACVSYGIGQIVQVEQDCNGFIIGHTQGFFNQDKWQGLNHANLAFKCDDDGNAINGLFN